MPSIANHLLLCLLALLPIVSSQSLLTGPSGAGLPLCGQNCANLIKAAGGCVPPAAPITNQAIYDDCFCNSAFLTTFKTSPAGICDAECPVATDLQQVQAWFLNLCSAGIASAYSDVAAAATASPSAAPTSAVVIPPVVTPAPSTLITSASSNNPASSAALPSGTTVGATNSLGGIVAPVTGTWWDNHKQWIAMVIVLIIGFSAIIVGGVVWKRRYTRRRNQNQNQNQAAAMATASSGMLAEKEKGRARGATAEEAGRGGKLRKFMRRG